MTDAEVAELVARLLLKETLDIGDVRVVATYLNRQSILHHEVAAALSALQAERHGLWEALTDTERAMVEAAIPLEALHAAGQGPLSNAVWAGVINGVMFVRAVLEKRAARKNH